jgi:thiol-disulfide isomerase/thioredoxin
MRYKLTALILLVQLYLPAQKAYKVGDVVNDINITKLLNHTTSSGKLSNLKNKITILDFFGTWCAPCIKALPELATYKEQFKKDLNIILVSTEEETKLTKFIANHQPFIFPLVVDENNLFADAFLPPSYPYTVVLNSNLKILSITNAKDLTEAMLQNFIKANTDLTATKIQDTANMPTSTMQTPAQISTNALVKLSQDFMYAAKTGEQPELYSNQLKDLPYNRLINELLTDEDKKAFWINLYNAYTSDALHKNPALYKKRNKFFKAKNIIVANKIFSLDKIEHGILRRSKIKWSLGYLNKWFPSKTEKQLRVNKVDWRIHFALNCGAKSCPPIAFYKPEQLSQQLDISTKNYLTSESVFNIEQNKIAVPVLFSWFRKDFGGKKNIVPILKKYNIIKETDNPRLSFKKYNWDLFLENYEK